MDHLIVLVVTLLSWSISQCDGSDILVVLPYGGKSHHQVFLPLIEKLADKNHHITFITMMTPSKVIPNVEYKVTEVGETFDKAWKSYMSKTLIKDFALEPFFDYVNLMDDMCKSLYEDPTFNNFREEISKNHTRYDVVIAMIFMSECYLNWISTLETPLILVSPAVIFPNTAWELGIPYPTSSVVCPLRSFNSTMNFKQRVANTVSSYFTTVLIKFVAAARADAVSSKYLQKSISSMEVLRNASLVLVNSHVSLDGSKPTLPHVIDVGGMHCRPGERLPKEFEEFVNGSGNEGFIVMSMGSVVQGNKLPKEFTALFKEVFAKVKQRVIWKYEDTIAGLSPNVMLSKWIPQQDLMAHPKCRLAITHGGLLSLQEVVYHGVPLLGVPLGADRDFNINQAVNKGFALILDWKNSNPEETLNKINSLINNKQFLEKAKELSVLTRDRPQPPVETAAYWVEYVIRHKGAPHLKNAGAQQLNLIQYLGIDVIAFLLAILFAILFIVFVIVRFTIKSIIRLCSRPKKVKTH